MMTSPEEIKYCLKGGEKMKTLSDYLSDYLYGLGILKPDNKLHRIIRRAVMAGLIVAVAELVKGIVPLSPEYAVPLIAAVGMAADKYLREKL